MRYINRKYREQDRDQLKKLLFASSEDESLLNRMEQFNIAYTAFIGHKLVGFTAAWTTNKFHPFCNNFLILSEPDFDVEGKLLVKLEEELDHLPLQTAIWETTTHLKSFYEDNDFDE